MSEQPQTGRGDSATGRRRAFVSLGSNLGDRERHLVRAREALEIRPGVNVLAASPLYETAPQDLADQPAFLNQVLCLETTLEPLALLRVCQAIELAEGRTREVRFGPRTLDLDILLFQAVETDDPELTLPHPRLLQRAFVLVPLADVWSCAREMPAFDVAGLAAELSREQAVTPYHRQGDA